MRKLILSLAVVALLGFFGANATGAAAGDIHATGAGWVSFQPATPKHFAHFDVSAHQGPSGGFGQLGFTINYPTFTL
ncbi:MAG: hypothetical protein WBB76_06380, partial [Gaiellaceae bacterium]